MSGKLLRRLAGWCAVGVALFLAWAPQTLAQGCALCYNNAAATGPQGARTLDRAILVLLIPVLFLFVSIFVFLYRRRNVQRISSPFGGVPPMPYRAL